MDWFVEVSFDLLFSYAEVSDVLMVSELKTKNDSFLEMQHCAGNS